MDRQGQMAIFHKSHNKATIQTTHDLSAIDVGDTGQKVSCKSLKGPSLMHSCSSDPLLAQLPLVPCCCARNGNQSM